MEFLTSRIKQYLGDPQVVILGVFLIVGTLLVIGLGKYLTPAIAALVIAYLLEGIVGRLERWVSVAHSPGPSSRSRSSFLRKMASATASGL